MYMSDEILLSSVGVGGTCYCMTRRACGLFDAFRSVAAKSRELLLRERGGYQMKLSFCI